MVSSEGLSRGSKFSREIAAITKDERPVGVQIFGSDPERMGEAARFVEDIGADVVDVNMGCPVPKVTRTGSGAALMRNERQAGRIVEKMVSRTSVPVTVKIRSGWDQSSINAPEVARVLESAGASAVTVHPRCRSERHRGRAAWPVIAAVKRAVTIPVIGNGDVRSVESARAMFEETGADGIMIGRGALANPWVFRQIVNGLEGRDTPSPTLSEYRLLFADFVADLQQYLPDRVVVNRIKAFIGWVTKGLPCGHALRKDVYAAKTLLEALRRFESYFELQQSKRPAAV
jgi:tRNA-dihydrouridine synthase B